MPVPRYKAQKDLNHKPIHDALLQLGFLVEDTSKMGDSFPDLVVKHPAKPEIGVRMVEIKSEKGKLKPGQAALKENWEDSILVVRTLDEILEFFGFI